MNALPAMLSLTKFRSDGGKFIVLNERKKDTAAIEACRSRPPYSTVSKVESSEIHTGPSLFFPTIKVRYGRGCAIV